MAEFIELKESRTDPAYGCPPHERDIETHISHGVVNLDKPSGPTSHQVDAWVRDMLHAEKVGHGGTLDPKVTGVLPLGINRATRVMQLLLEAPKEYVCLMRVHREVDEDRIREVLGEFQGKIFQIPPLKSAVKRELRVRTIYDVNILEIDGQDVLFRIACEAGTYVRKYCHDVGEALGTGAHMAELRRTRVGPFTEEGLVTLHDLKDAYQFWVEDGDERFLRECTLPMEFAVSHLPRAVILDSAVDAVCHGADLARGGIAGLDDNIKKGDTVAVMTLKGELVAVGEALMPSLDIVAADSGLVIETDKVFMKPGTYPRMWRQSP
ncbi:RNA-guided pseudouridylation complex pseudouridine synthase subunit Cbf5 [Methanothermobacter marburgensis]|uniref:RNA-guided pseudouridylation complex pseudouridine synthase subunit Cbf5 n=1 Tax=Methanothermobacter marburgensis TaxID=145263 RepID=UPI0035BA9DDF